MRPILLVLLKYLFVNPKNDNIAKKPIKYL